MTIRFNSNELPLAYSMIAAAKRVRPRRDGRHPFDRYFLYWTAFSGIYTAIANRKGHKNRVRRNATGEVLTSPSGSVNIPQVEVVSEQKQIHLALEEFGNDLKHTLILHEGTKYFSERVPFWGGKQIEFDAFEQRLNGVINVNHTSDPQYPIWSPIDLPSYKAYLHDPSNEAHRDFLAGQILDLLYTIRLNLMHFGRTFDDAQDIEVVVKALPMLALLVGSFTS
jgi:hypothetical protein